jgi:copper(I)-binding protein
MLMSLAEPLVAGAEFDLTLEFEGAGDVVVTVTVRDA